MKFFQSEVVQEELTQMQELYMDINRMGLMLNAKEKREQLDKMLRLIELQQTMYMRVTLSDDPEAKEMKNQMRKSLQGMGFPEGTDMPSIFSAMDETIGKLKESVD